MSEQEAEDFLLALGAEVAKWRKLRGLSREELGDLVDKSATTIGRIERGQGESAMATTDAWRIAAHLGITFSDLVRSAEDAVEMDSIPRAARKDPRRQKPRLGD